MDRDNGSNQSDVSEDGAYGGGDDRTFGNIDDALAALAHEEDQATEELTDSDDTEDDQADDEPDADEADDEAEEVDDDAEDDDEGSDDDQERMIALPSGEMLPESELAAGYMKAQDYTRKTQAIAEERKQVEQIGQKYREGAQSLVSQYQQMQQFLESVLPPEPDLALAQADPGQYQFQRALREQATRELQQFMAGGQQAQQSVQQMSAQDAQQYQQQEQAKLVEALPALKDPIAHDAFMSNVAKVGQTYGFSADEIAAVQDARILQMVHDAGIGRKVRENRKPTQKKLAEKAQKGPAPQRSRQRVARPSSNAKVMRRLAQTGDINDALKLDF